MTIPIQVAVEQCAVYDRQKLVDSVEAVAPFLGLKHSCAGSTVMLKPNLISSRGPALACTHGKFLAAITSWFLDHGAKVRIGDSPAFGTATSVMTRHGLLKALTGMDVELVDFSRPVSKRLSVGVRVEIAAEALECDLFVNLPKLKAHNQMYLTAGVKNIFGIVLGMRKALLHMRHGGSHREFSEILLQLPSLLPAQVTLVDGIEAMHISGPLDGVPLNVGCLVGSPCPVALDTSLLHLLELSPERSPLWLAANACNHPGSRTENIRYPLSQPEDFAGTGFIAPGSLNGIRFNPFRFIGSTLRRFALAIRS